MCRGSRCGLVAVCSVERCEKVGIRQLKWVKTAKVGAGTSVRHGDTSGVLSLVQGQRFSKEG
jgi:hypothetical protein